MTLTSKPLSVSVAVGDRALRQFSQNALEAFLPSMISTSEMLERGSEMVAATVAFRPAVLVTDLAALGEGYAETIRKLRSQTVPPDVLVLHHSADGGAILKAMRAGAREFFHEEIEESLRTTISAIASESRLLETTGKLYAFMAAKGGSGVTTVASHAAASLGRASKEPVLFADLNWGSSSAAFFLRADPQYTFEKAARSMERMDRALWDAMVTKTTHGFSLAPPPASEKETEPINPDHLSALLRFCKTQYTSVVADCGDGIHPLSLTVMEAAAEIVLVTCSDVLALHHAKRMVRVIQELGCGNRLRLVLNRVRRSPDLKQSEIETMVGHPIFASVPNDYQSLMQACEAGVLLSPEHPVTKSIAAFTAQFAGAAPTHKKKRFGLFGN